MQQKFTMNKALEQKLIGPMEESHTKQQSPKAVLWMELSARRSKIAAKWARIRAWARWGFFWEEDGVCVGAGISGGGPPGAHETGGAPRGARHPPSWLPLALLGVVSKSLGSCSVRKSHFRRFYSVWTLFHILFIRNTEIGKKQQFWAGSPVNRLVPKII